MVGVEKVYTGITLFKTNRMYDYTISKRTHWCRITGKKCTLFVKTNKVNITNIFLVNLRNYNNPFYNGRILLYNTIN